MQQLINIIKNHKRTIAAIAGPVITWSLAKGWIGPDDATMAATVLSIWSGVALGHAAVKAKK